ncbi:MAG TPA: hypothetical protein PKD64_08780 [Pirellulaceae bacterium]|nr:hypothetical protein [Pirellulaceae bacterium]HMO92281.1 hypothetical protein [Pirellulaceae bacterium]HMP70099.1 hypothetical protein [Pirellulaceae bacterium]
MRVPIAHWAAVSFMRNDNELVAPDERSAVTEHAGQCSGYLAGMLGIRVVAMGDIFRDTQPLDVG